MADKMMRIGGRSEEGYAKAIKTDDEGRLLVRANGVITLDLAVDMEVRDSNTLLIEMPPERVLNRLTDFEIYVTDTHTTNEPTTNHTMDMNFGFAGNGYAAAFLSYMPYEDDQKRPFKWTVGSPAYAGRYTAFISSLKGTTDRGLSQAFNRDNISLTQMIRMAEYSFYESDVKQDINISLEERNDFLKEVKTRVMLNLGNDDNTEKAFRIRYPEAPTAGRLSVRLVGRVS